MRFPSLCSYVALSLVALCAVPSLPAGADPSSAGSAPVALDATHFVVLRGDRMIVYEVDPKRGYELRVVNSALLDENGLIIGQFRPEVRPSAASPEAPAPARPAPAPPAPQPGPAATPERLPHVQAQSVAGARGPVPGAMDGGASPSLPTSAPRLCGADVGMLGRAPSPGRLAIVR